VSWFYAGPWQLGQIERRCCFWPTTVAMLIEKKGILSDSAELSLYLVCLQQAIQNS
jgi:hypothetical protein